MINCVDLQITLIKDAYENGTYSTRGVKYAHPISTLEVSIYIHYL